jgi:integrase
MTPDDRRHRRRFGSVRQLPNGRYQARYTAGPKGDSKRYTAGTYGQRRLAERALEKVSVDIDKGSWIPPDAVRSVDTFGDYAEVWLSSRKLKPRTRQHYRSILDRDILPTFSRMPLEEITKVAVRTWHSTLPHDHPTRTAHAYSLLRTVLQTAVADDLLAANPCQIRGAGTAPRQRRLRPASVPELVEITNAMPAKYQAAVRLSAWTGIRFGEMAELRRKDVDLDEGVLRIRRAVTARGEIIVGTPKSDASIRDVAIPPHLLGMLREHLAQHAGQGPNGLVFPAADGVRNLAASTLYKPFNRARTTAGRPDLRWHDLRHTGAVLAATTGATLAELMGRLGHSSPGAAMRYQHVAKGRDKQIAAALSKLVEDD